MRGRGMRLEELLTEETEEKTELSFIIIKEDRFYISLVKYFPNITSISKIMEYSRSDVVIFTKEGNLEYYSVNGANRIEPIIRDFEKKEFEKHYEGQDISFSCLVNHPSLTKGVSDRRREDEVEDFTECFYVNINAIANIVKRIIIETLYSKEKKYE